MTLQLFSHADTDQQDFLQRVREWVDYWMTSETEIRDTREKLDALAWSILGTLEGDHDGDGYEVRRRNGDGEPCGPNIADGTLRERFYRDAG